MQIEQIPQPVLERLRHGCVIPAHPLALTEERTLSERHQRALSRYYVDAGAGAVAVGVHTTQFEIRDPSVGLLEPVLRLAAETVDDWSRRRDQAVGRIAGVCGPTDQAVREAGLAQELGYHACLVSLAALAEAPVAALVEHCREVGQVMPLVGFYLNPAIGGRVLPYDFWRRFAEIENVLAIKVAPFDRYKSLETLRGVCDAGAADRISLYTGNDDTIVTDLLTQFRLECPAGPRRLRIVGGLLGHWAVWTRKAVELLQTIHSIVSADVPVPPELLTRAAEVTDCNAAVFDAANGFAGVNAGVLEVLRRQGLVPGAWCLNPKEGLSPGQAEELDRVTNAYPHLVDDDFVAQHRDEWLAD